MGAFTLPMKEILNTRFNQTEWLKHLNDNPALFEEAMEIALSDLKPQAWRAAWLITKLDDFQPSKINRYVNTIVKILPFREEGHQRTLLKLIEGVSLTETQESKLFDHCLTIYENIGKQGSVRITAFSTLIKIANNYPELKGELRHLTEEHYTESFSPGIKHSFEILARKHLNIKV